VMVAISAVPAWLLSRRMANLPQPDAA
jgi:hypothetical protein